MYIYRIIFPDGKSYVGSTKDFRRRKNSHLSKARNGNKNKVSRTIRYFGEGNLKWEVLMDNVSENKIEMYEGAFVSFYNSYTNGYNATKLGQGSLSKKVLNLSNGTVYSSIHEASRREYEQHRTVQRSIENKCVTAKYNLFLLEEEYKKLDCETRIRMEETIRYKKDKGIKGLWPNHKREIQERINKRIEVLKKSSTSVFL
jgi:hypothetical protein